MNPSPPTWSLLPSVRVPDLRQDPFDHLACRPVFEPEVYRHLAETFPSMESVTQGRSDYGSNHVIRMGSKEVLESPAISDAWKAFFAYHTSAAWWGDLVRVWGSRIQAVHPDLEDRVGKPLAEWTATPRGGNGDVRLDCLFVWNTPVKRRSSVKAAHVDRAPKVVSALFYCRDPRDHSTGGDLAIHRLKARHAFDAHQVPDRHTTVVDVIPYEANKLISFVNSPTSVHSVTPRSPTEIPRRYVNLIAELPFPIFSLPTLTGWSRLWYRAFQRQKTRNWTAR